MQKYIYIHCTNIGESAKPETPTDSATNLRIGGKEINFLDDHIAKSIRSESSDHNKWKLQFFAETPYCVEFYVYFNQNPRDYSGTQIFTNELAKGVIAKRPDTTHNNDLFSRISKIIRNSTTLKADYYLEHHAGHYCIDGSGIVWITDFDHDLNADRFIYLYLLARAYEFAMQNLIDRYAKIKIDFENIGEDQFKQLKHASYSISSFNILHYSNFPVKSQNNLLKSIWAELSTHFKLAEKNQEITKQAHDFKQLIELEALEQRSQREKNNAKTIQTYFYVLAIIPIILTVIGWFLAHYKVI